MQENEEIPSVPSIPATPGTLGAPLFGGFKFERNHNNNGIARNSLLNGCKCFDSVQDWTLEDGALPKLSCSLLPPPISLARKVGAEFIGTFIVMFAGTAAAIVNEKTNGSESLMGCAATTGLAVMVIIFSTAHISGAHLNPAVAMYIGAQVLASICAAFALKWIYNPFMSGGVTVCKVGYGQAFALEFIITFNLMFVVTAVATDTRVVGELAGIAVGATVMLNILIAGPATGGSMNPVRTLGPAIATKNYKAIWIYLIAPILGALGGTLAYTAVKLQDEHENPNAKVPSNPRSFRR
ncbi:putative major intrinsic protein [Lupinus albus]|uniref:Putative major intrinsic protein n=1 Tax=Lupinus albus TaxID=3870 RepID=A0A6A4R7Y6_LUPAL|nr:putative major intrinsic protein [Lupinus albus]